MTPSLKRDIDIQMFVLRLFAKAWPKYTREAIQEKKQRINIFKRPKH